MVGTVRVVAVGITAVHVVVEAERWWWSGQRGWWQLASPPFVMVVVPVKVEWWWSRQRGRWRLASPLFVVVVLEVVIQGGEGGSGW